MSGFSMVPTKLWNEASFRRLSDDGKLVLLFLHGCTRVFPGCVARAGVIAETLAWSSDRVRGAINDLVQAAFIDHDPETGVTLVRYLLEQMPPRGPKQAAGARRGFDDLPDCAVSRRAFAAVAAALTSDDRAKFTDPTPAWFGKDGNGGNPIDRVSIPYPAPSDTPPIPDPKSSAYRTVPNSTKPNRTDARAPDVGDGVLALLRAELGGRFGEIDNVDAFGRRLAKTLAGAPNRVEVLRAACRNWVRAREKQAIGPGVLAKRVEEYLADPGAMQRAVAADDSPGVLDALESERIAKLHEQTEQQRRVDAERAAAAAKEPRKPAAFAPPPNFAKRAGGEKPIGDVMRAIAPPLAKTGTDDFADLAADDDDFTGGGR